MAKHRLESKYGLSRTELLDVIDARPRVKLALEGAVAEFQMEKQIRSLVGSIVARYEAHDLDGHPDFSIWLPDRTAPLLAECKTIRESGKHGYGDYREGEEIAAYKVETQKAHAGTSDPTSRFYDVGYCHILGVCLGNKTGDWTDFLFARAVDLLCHPRHPHKLAVFQRVPLPDAANLSPWYADLGELLRRYDDPPCR
jgi:hypothetical protein